MTLIFPFQCIFLHKLSKFYLGLHLFFWSPPPSVYCSQTFVVGLLCIWKDRLYLMKCITLMTLKEVWFGKKLSSCFPGISTLCYYQPRYVSVLNHIVHYWHVTGDIIAMLFPQLILSCAV